MLPLVLYVILRSTTNSRKTFEPEQNNLTIFAFRMRASITLALIAMSSPASLFFLTMPSSVENIVGANTMARFLTSIRFWDEFSATSARKRKRKVKVEA